MSAALFHRERLLAYPGQRTLRLVAGALLTVSMVMVVLGVTVLENWLQALRYVVYWGWCAVFTIAALVVAFCDVVLVRRAGRQSRRNLFEQQILSEDLRQKLSASKDKPAQ